MTVTRKHTHYGVSVGATLVGGINRQNLVTGSQVRSEATSGEVYARFTAMYSQRVAPGFTTLNVAAALGAAAVTGASIADMTGGLSLWAYKHLSGGSRATGSTHRKYNFTTGILAPRTLRVSHRGDAALTYDAVIAHDGSNDPVVITDSVALPSGLTDAERFTLGPASIAGVTLGEKTELEIDFGLDVVEESADSEIWATFVSIRQQQTRITYRGIDIEWFKDATGIPLEGKEATHANTIFYLRKRAKHGTFVLDATAEHVKFTAGGLAYIDNAFDASADKAAETSLVIQLDFDGTNAPLTVNAASAIT